ncbi:MAG: hypothetical protein NT120_00410 [Candidatus Aenigmarchaeota archaeon]|nr:hypothetical protein [Candidatus Aenigmarchaeota archaeon]
MYPYKWDEIPGIVLHRLGENSKPETYVGTLVAYSDVQKGGIPKAFPPFEYFLEQGQRVDILLEGRMPTLSPKIPIKEGDITCTDGIASLYENSQFRQLNRPIKK